MEQNNAIRDISVKNGKTEPEHDRTNKITCVPNKESNKPGYSPSLSISLCCVCVLDI